MQTLALIVLGTGAIFAAIFHFGTKEKHSNDESSVTDSDSVLRKMGALCWLKTGQFYVVSFSDYFFNRRTHTVYLRP